MVTATVTGSHEIKALTINPEAVDPDDVEMLCDMVIAAVNEAMRQYSPDEIDTAIKQLGRGEEQPVDASSVELLDMEGQPGSMALDIEGQTSDFGSEMANMGGI